MKVNWKKFGRFTLALCVIATVTTIAQLPWWGSFVTGGLIGALWPDDIFTFKS